MQKKTIIHFIYKLERGGAEIMLIRVIKELPEYNNIILEIYGKNSFRDVLRCDKYISMNLKSLFLLPIAVIKLRRIIKENNVDLVHTHLLWPTVVARIATPKKIPLITTIHTSVSTSLDYQLRRVRIIDRITSRIRKSIIVGVSKSALSDYLTFLKIRPVKAYTLHTFVDTECFNLKNPGKSPHKGKLLLVSVGALRPGKNFEYLIRAFSRLDNLDIELHIYGAGPLQKKLKKAINETNVRVILKGEVTNINELLPLYDLYVTASAFEGFSLSVLEAMAMKLPLLLSDIKSFREQCSDTATYFDLNDEGDFTNKLNALIANPEKMSFISEKAQNRVLENFTLPHHVSGLKRIYKETFAIE